MKPLPDSDILVDCLQMAQDQLSKEGWLPTTLLLKAKTGLEVYVMEGPSWGPSAEDRFKTLYLLGATIGYGLEAESIFVFTDSYIKTVDTPKGTTREEAEELALNRTVSLADDPEAREAILACEIRN